MAKAAYEKILSLPIFPGMSDADAMTWWKPMGKVMEYYRR